MNDFLQSRILEWFSPDMIVRSVVIYFFIVWFCLVVWVVRDITSRSRSILIQVLSIILVLFLTPLGIFIYLLLRPQKTLFEQVFEDEFFRLDAEFSKTDTGKHKQLPHTKTLSPGMDIIEKKNTHR